MNVKQYYETNYPGQVQVLGPDVGLGNLTQLADFGVDAEATYPLLQRCSDGSAVSDTNLLVPYNQKHNFVVIDKQGIIRYHAHDLWPFGNRYHPNELRDAINPLVTNLAGVNEPGVSRIRLAASPNPFDGETRVEFSNPAGFETHASVHVLDLAGRRVARLWDGPAPSGATRVRWDGRADSGATLSPGVYLLHAVVGGERFTRRLVRIH